MAGVRAAHAALAQLGFVAIVAGALAVGGFGAPMLPLLVVPGSSWTGGPTGGAAAPPKRWRSTRRTCRQGDAGRRASSTPATSSSAAARRPPRHGEPHAGTPRARPGRCYRRARRRAGRVGTRPRPGRRRRPQPLAVSARGLDLRLRADWRGKCAALAPVAGRAPRRRDRLRPAARTGLPLRGDGARARARALFVTRSAARRQTSGVAAGEAQSRPRRSRGGARRFAYAPAAVGAGALQAVAGSRIGAATLALLAAAAALVRRSRVVA